jgi:hypothetical protein
MFRKNHGEEWGAGVPPTSTRLFWNINLYIHKLICLTHLDPEDRGSMYFQNVNNTAHIHMV